MTKYTIKPLEWSKTRHGNVTAHGPGCYSVFKHDDGTFYWNYCWTEYYDEEKFECENFKDGKKKAEEHYRARVLKFLDVAED